MDAFWQTSTFFGIFITLFFYGVGMFLKQKVKHTLVNPLLIAIVFTILFLHLFGIDYKTYNNSAKYISYLMTPATICLAVPLYRQLDTLKRNFKAVMFGITSSVIVTMVSVLAFSRFPSPHLSASAWQKNWEVTFPLRWLPSSSPVSWATFLRNRSVMFSAFGSPLPKVSPSAAPVMLWVR